MSNKKSSPTSRVQSLGKRIGDLEEVIKLICGWVKKESSLPPEELQTEVETQAAASPSSSPVETHDLDSPSLVLSSSLNPGNAHNQPTSSSTADINSKNPYVKLIRCDYLMPNPTTDAAVNIPGVRLHSCAKCSLQFTSFVELECHRRKEHGKSTYVQRTADNRHYFQCPKCDKVISRFNIAHHVKMHDKPQIITTHQCKRCPQRFKSQVLLAVHNRAEHLNINICVLCSQNFRSRDELIGHQMYHRMAKSATSHPKPTNPAPEQISPVSSRNITSKSDSNPIIRYFCNQCPLKFEKQVELKYHKAKLHPKVTPQREPDGRTWLKCPKCPKTLHRTSYERHLELHSQNKIKPVEKHVCATCFQEFSNKQVLYMHNRTVHVKISNEAIFQCSKCPLQFPSRMELIVHRSVHKVVDPNKDKRICDICLKTVHRCHLQSHRQTHFREKEDPLA